MSLLISWRFLTLLGLYPICVIRRSAINPLGAYMAGTLFLNKLKCFLTMMGKTDLFAVLCVDRLGIQDRCTMVASDVSC